MFIRCSGPLGRWLLVALAAWLCLSAYTYGSQLTAFLQKKWAPGLHPHQAARGNSSDSLRNTSAPTHVVLHAVSNRSKEAVRRPSTGIKVNRIMGPIPSLVLAGVDKGGTSEAYQMLHQEFLLEDGGGQHKELGCLYQVSSIPGKELAKVRSCYSAFFHELGTNASEHILPVDATPNYLYSNRLHPLALSPPKVLSVISPQASVVFLLREPISRIRSLYNHFWHQSARWDLSGRLQDQIKEELMFVRRIKRQAHTRSLFAGFMHAECVNQTNQSSCNMWDFWIQLRHQFLIFIRNVRRNRSPKIDGKAIMPYVLTAMYFPFLYTWLQFFHRVAVIQAEYFFQDTSRLWQILGIQPHQAAALHPGQPPLNSHPYDNSSMLSTKVQKHMRCVFAQLLDLKDCLAWLVIPPGPELQLKPSVPMNCTWALGPCRIYMCEYKKKQKNIYIYIQIVLSIYIYTYSIHLPVCDMGPRDTNT